MKKNILFITLLLLFIMTCGEKPSNELQSIKSYNFESGNAEGWHPNFPNSWKVIDFEGSKVYALTTPGESGEVAAPKSWSVIADLDLTSFEFTGKLKCLAEIDNPNRDLCIFFHYQDPTHFYYVHFSASSDERHNIIGLVDGADRIKINVEPAGSSIFRLTDKEWHSFKVTYSAETGSMMAFLDDMETPIVTAKDSVLGHGSVGIGSYDDLGYFDDLSLKGQK